MECEKTQLELASECACIITIENENFHLYMACDCKRLVQANRASHADQEMSECSMIQMMTMIGSSGLHASFALCIPVQKRLVEVATAKLQASWSDEPRFH